MKIARKKERKKERNWKLLERKKENESMTNIAYEALDREMMTDIVFLMLYVSTSFDKFSQNPSIKIVNNWFA